MMKFGIFVKTIFRFSQAAHSYSKDGRLRASPLQIKSRWTGYWIIGYFHRGILQSRATIAKLAAKPRHRIRDLFVPDEPTRFSR